MDGSATTSTSSAALIAETLQQIDRLGLELDNYCDGLEENAENSNNNIKNGQRNEAIMGMGMRQLVRKIINKKIKIIISSGASNNP